MFEADMSDVHPDVLLDVHPDGLEEQTLEDGRFRSFFLIANFRIMSSDGSAMTSSFTG